MAEIEVNGVGLYYELHGIGKPLAMVHGSWSGTMSWGLVVPGLAESFTVLVYDRRGHSRSARQAKPGSVDEDGDDLAALLEALDLAPAHVLTNSWGGKHRPAAGHQATGGIPLADLPRAPAMGPARG